MVSRLARHGRPEERSNLSSLWRGPGRDGGRRAARHRNALPALERIFGRRVDAVGGGGCDGGVTCSMSLLEFAPLVFFISTVAGFLGALTGLGGGVVITPALTLLMGVDIRYAIGASLVSVIATSSGAAAAYVREGFTNIRIGMFL